jgi:hypothetical protein
MMRALLWKDLRLTVPVFVAAVLLSVIPYVCTITLAVTMGRGSIPWAETIVAGTHFGQWLILLIAAFLGGNVFACEREDESFRFLTALAVRPRAIVLSKVIVTVVTLECLWIASAAAMHASTPFALPGLRATLPGAADMPAIAAASLLVLGLSWVASGLLARPVVAAICGLLVSGAVYLALHVGAGLVLREEHVVQPAQLSPVAALAGVVACVVACAHFLLRNGGGAAPPPRAESSPLGRCARTARPLSRPSDSRRTRGFGALLWKDWRLIRAALLVGAALAATPYAGAAALALTADAPMQPFARAATQSLWLSCGVVAIWSGLLVGTERRTKSDRYLHALPVRQSRLAESKLLVAALPSLLVIGSNIFLAVAFHALVFEPSPLDDARVPFGQMTWALLLWQPASLLFALPAIGAPFVCFGVAWLASAWFGKPFIGIASGTASAFVVLAGWMAFSTLVQEITLPLEAALAYAVCAGLTGCVCTLWGCRFLIVGEAT